MLQLISTPLASVASSVHMLGQDRQPQLTGPVSQRLGTHLALIVPPMVIQQICPASQGSPLQVTGAQAAVWTAQVPWLQAAETRPDPAQSS